MQTRKNALDQVKALQDKLIKYQLATADIRPADTSEPLNKDLAQAITALEDKIKPLQSTLTALNTAIGREAKASPTAALPNPLMTRLNNAVTDYENLYNSPEAKSFQQCQIAVQLKSIEISLNLINDTFEVDYQNSQQVRGLSQDLRQIASRLTTLKNNPNDITDEKISELATKVDNSITLLSTYKDTNARNLEDNASFANQIQDRINILTALPDAQTQIDALFNLMEKTSLLDTTLFDQAEEARDKLVAQKQAVETAKTELTTAKSKILESNTSKKDILLAVKKQKGLYASSLDAEREIKRGIIDAENTARTLTQQLQQATIDASKPQVDVAVSRIDRFVVELKALARNPAITSPIFKSEIDNFIKQLETKKSDIQLPANIIKYKGQNAAEIISTAVINNELKLKDIATAKIQITSFIRSTQTALGAIDNDAAVRNFKIALQAVLLGLEHHSLKLDDMKITASDIDTIKAELVQFRQGIRYYDDSLDAYRTAAVAITKIGTTLNELKATFPDKAKASTEAKQFFTALETEQAKLDKQLKAIAKGQAALLNDPKNADDAALLAVIKDINSNATKATRSELIENANLEIVIQQESEKIENAAKIAKTATDKLRSDIQTIVDQIETTTKDAETIINEIEGLDQTASDAKVVHKTEAAQLKQQLTAIKTQLNNPTSALRTEADDALIAATTLKTAAEQTKTTEDNNNPTAVARAIITKLQKDAKSKIQLFKDDLDAIRAIKIEEYDDEARKNIKMLDKFLTQHEKDLEKLEATIAKADKAATIPPGALPSAKVDQDVLDAIASKENALKELDSLVQSFTSKNVGQVIADWQEAIEDRKDIAANPYLPKKVAPKATAATANTAAVPAYQFTVSNPKKAFQMLDESMLAHINTIAHWERTIFAATASAKARRELTPQARTEIEDKVRDMHRALLFYQTYSSKHPGLVSALAKKYVADQIDKLNKIEMYFPDLQGDQKYVLTGSGVTGIQYYRDFAAAQADLNTSLPASQNAISSKVDTGRTEIVAGDAVRRDHEMVVTKQDGSTERLKDQMITHINPVTKSLQTNFYEDADSIKDIPDVETRAGLLKVVSRPADPFLEEAYNRLKVHLADPRNKGGAIYIHSGMPPKKCKAMLLVMKINGIKLDANCLPLIHPNAVTADEVKLSAKAMEKLGYPLLKLKEAIERNEVRSEEGMSRFRKS